VRDEAGRARDDGRLLPVSFEAGELPLGFGQIHTEDFSGWNGAKNAAQVQILAEVIKARIEGRDVDGAAVAGKRKRLAGRIRLMSILTAVAALVGIAAGVSTILNNRQKPIAPIAQPQEDALARLLRLVEEGKISGEEAIELAKLLQSQAFADAAPTREVSFVDSAPNAEPAPTGDPGLAEAPSIRSAPATGLDPETAQAASISADQMAEAARSTFADAAAQLLQDPDPRVRAAVVRATNPATREAAFKEMWTLASEGGASSAAIWRACGALMSAASDPRALEALERARELNPQDKRVWRMLSAEYGKQSRVREAAGAALVGVGLEAAADGKTGIAAARLEKALPLVVDPKERAFVLGQLGDQAEARGELADAEEAYKKAISLHVERRDVGAISVDASKLARVQMQKGLRRDACRTLSRAKDSGAAVSEEELNDACGERLRLAPRPELQRAPPPSTPQP
jgi:tetratricopeptide (TPR) repeat protein